MYIHMYNVIKPVKEFGLVMTTFSPTPAEALMSCLSPMITSTGITIVNTTSGQIGRNYLFVVAQLLM